MSAFQLILLSETQLGQVKQALVEAALTLKGAARKPEDMMETGTLPRYTMTHQFVHGGFLSNCVLLASQETAIARQERSTVVNSAHC